MKSLNRWLTLVLFLTGLLLSACATKPSRAEKIDPVKLEPIVGTEFKRVILTEKAAQRIGIETVTVSGTAVPYAAVIYDTKGNTWVYTNPEPLTYVRKSVVIDHIEGDQAILSQALAEDTAIVIVGVAELYGAETGVSK